MNHYAAVMHLFPEAVVRQDFTLRNDGDGTYIDVWNLEEPKPTEEELLAAWEAVQIEEASKPPVKSLEDQLEEARTIQAQLSQELAVQKDINTANSQNFMDLVDYLTEKGVLE